MVPRVWVLTRIRCGLALGGCETHQAEPQESYRNSRTLYTKLFECRIPHNET